MRKLLLVLFFLTSSLYWASAQEIPSDTIRRAPASTIKEFGGFLLDMGLINATAPKLPAYSLEIPDLSKDYNRLFQLNKDVTFSQGFTDNTFFSPFGYGSGYNWGLPFSSPYLQMGSFKLKNGWSMNTYGDYNKEGWKVPDRSAMPWEKNNFRGAFELKSPNGSFGVRIEVKQGRDFPY